MLHRKEIQTFQILNLKNEGQQMQDLSWALLGCDNG